jgi:hypothetical protein
MTDPLLITSRDRLLDSVRGLSEAQWHFRPAPERWSIAGVVEHVALIEGLIHGIVGRLGAAPVVDPGAAPCRNDAEIDEFIRVEVPRREAKLEAPPMVQPTGNVAPEESLRRFVEARARTLELFDSAPHLRGRVLPHPAFGPWDGYQWLLAAGSHAARHTGQILEIKSHEGFPQ